MREWIVTNGLGGYASLTYDNSNTRKYHGLLVSSLNPPTKRWMFISNIFDKIKTNEKTYNLNGSNCVFTYDLFPSFFYHFEGNKIKKTIFMENEKNTTIIKYDIKIKNPIQMIHTPHVNSRHIYDVTYKRDLDFQIKNHSTGISIKPGNIDKNINIFLEKSSYKPSFFWEEFFYDKDKERNDSWVDNNVHLGDFIKEIKKDTTYYIVLTLEKKRYDAGLSKIFEKEKKRKKELLKHADISDKYSKLVLSSDDFIVSKENDKTVVAGYHWFADWGRDTLISLPGLTLITKRYDEAKKILYGFSKYCKKGLIPNAFMERDSKAVYNNVDSSLWYIDRVYQYLKYTDDKSFLKKIFPTLESIIKGYMEGTFFDIHMDHDYLISHGPGLTWMDVKIGDYYPTPRAKKAVEIQALWYNSLCIMSGFSQIIGKKDKYLDLSKKVKESFIEKYDQQYDVIDTQDTSNRPNKIFLVSLDYTMIKKDLAKKIVENVKKHLLTPFGLRTLSQDNPNYKPYYFGDYNKDESYHNGTVWPWLLGPFVKAFLKVNKGPIWEEYSYKHFIKPIFDIYGERWGGNIHEIFDAEPIYAPRGCITQAWSVAEILRCLIEDIENIKPDYNKILNESKIVVKTR